MPRFRTLLVLCAMTAALPCAAATDYGSVTGHVYCDDTLKPARFAMVMLVSAGAAIRGGSGSATDADGSFTISHVEAGQYYITVEYPGYISAMALVQFEQSSSASETDLQKQLGGSARQVTVTANQVSAVEVKVERGAVLSGTVRYDDGSPAVNISTRLYHKGSDGKWARVNGSLSSMFNGTDDRGSFRTSGLPAGEYKVLAVPGERRFRGRDSKSDLIRAYYGDTISQKDALVIALGPGEDRPGVNITLPIVNNRRVSGAVQSASDGHGLSHADVTLAIKDEPDGSLHTTTADDGQFLFSPVPDGDYTVSVAGASEAGADNSGSTYQGGSQDIKVKDGDKSDIVFSLQKTATPKAAQ